MQLVRSNSRLAERIIAFFFVFSVLFCFLSFAGVITAYAKNSDGTSTSIPREAYIVDDSTNALDFNPTILQ